MGPWKCREWWARERSGLRWKGRMGQDPQIQQGFVEPEGEIAADFWKCTMAAISEVLRTGGSDSVRRMARVC